MRLLQNNWGALVNMIFSGVGLAGILLAFIAWRRFRVIDKAKAIKIEAEAGELQEKTLDWRTQRDEKMFGVSSAILDRLNSENTMRTQQLEETEAELREIKHLLFDATNKCSLLEQKVKMYEEQSAECHKVIEKMKAQLAEQRIELDILHKNKKQ